MNYRITLVVFTYNEVTGLRQLIGKIPLEAVDEVFAVDGGSNDGTLGILETQGIKVILQEIKGRGEAFRLAMKEATSDYVIFFSPDGNEDPQDILQFRKYAEEGYDMVIASRMMNGAHNEEDEDFFKWRKWANNAFNFFANLFFRKKGQPYVTDSINGFRMIKKTAFNLINPDGQGYTIEYQMTIRALKKSLKIGEFPTHEGKRLGGESYAKSLPVGIAFLNLLFHEILLSFKAK